MEEINVSHLTFPTEQILDEENIEKSSTSDNSVSNSNYYSQTPGSYEQSFDVSFNNYNDIMVYNLGNTYLDSQGKILELSLKLKNVSPGKKVAVGIMLFETDCSNKEHPKGLKTLTVPAHNSLYPQDILLQNIRFVLPADCDIETVKLNESQSRQRNFIVKVIVHYIDFSYLCNED